MTSSTPLSAIFVALASQPATWISAARAQPVAVACALLGTLLMLWRTVGGVPDVLNLVTIIALMTCGIGFFAALAMDWGLRRQGWWPKQARTFVSAVVIVVAGATLFAIPDHEEARLFPYLYWQGGAILMALYYALRPPKDAPEERAHLIGWYAGARVLLSAATGWALATLLAGGITVALFACEELLGLDVGVTVFEVVWILAYGIVWPMAFLTGATQAMPEEEHERAPVPERTPRWVAVAVNWALIPLALLYMAILYVYLVQLVLGVAGDFGSVAALNAAYLAFGVGTYVAALPLATQGSTVAGLYRRIFPWTIPLPLLALAWCVWIRLFAYGMTEARALLVIAVIWLVLVSLAWLLKGNRAGPATPVGLLGLLLVLGAQGPWGAPELTLLSQERALRGLLADHGMIEDGRAKPAEGEVPKADQQRLAHLLTYFHDRGTNYRIAELFPLEQATAPERIKALGLTVSAAVVPLRHTLTAQGGRDLDAIPVSGFDVVAPVYVGARDAEPAVVQDVATVRLDGSTLVVAPTAADTAPVRLDLAPMVAAAFTEAGDPPALPDGEPDRFRLVDLAPDAMMVEGGDADTDGATADAARVRLYVTALVLRHDGSPESAMIERVEGKLLVKTPE